MQILSVEARTQAARERLRKSRRWASALLLAACVLFVCSAAWVHKYAWLGYVKAFAEASMVGALADWFAVTALFRRPLGLPIPHTAILPRNQERIANELGRFIENNFLQGKPIALRIYQAEPSSKLLNWLSDEKMRRQWLPWFAKQVPSLLNVAKPEQVARFGSMMLAEQYTGSKIGKTLSDGLDLICSQNLHHTLLLAMLEQARKWLHNPETRAVLEQNLREWAVKIESDAPSAWDKLKASLKSSFVEKVDGWVAEKALDWADSYLEAALNDSEHTIRRNFDEQVVHISSELRYSAAWHAKLEQGKMQIARSEALQQSLMRAWKSVQVWAAEDVLKHDSVCLAQIEKLLNHMLSQAAAYPQFMRRADLRISLMVRDFVLRYKNKGAQFVVDKVKSWDSNLMVEKLELSVGKDLQFIRINGTIVGGLVGLLIYVLSQWLF